MSRMITSRKLMMVRFISYAAFILTLTVGIGWVFFREEPKRAPNIVFILADDLGWMELGSYGNTFNETPHLDRLAAEGMRFTDAYAAAPVCSPTRASLLTGMHPSRVGITNYLCPDDPKHLLPEYFTLAEVLRQRGYNTGILGKWHLTGYKNHGAKEVSPAEHGFDETLISENRGIAGGSYFHPYHFNREIHPRLPGKEYLVDRMNLEAVEFIERHRNESFFLFLSHYAVHTKLVGKPDRVAEYQKKPGAGKGEQAKINNVHLAAQLESIDEGVGMIVDKLEELGLTGNTLLIFTSDNGGESATAGVTVNGPLRAGKSTLYEGGIRVPLIVRRPRTVEPGIVSSIPVTTVDFYPTFCALAGVRPDRWQHLDGLSLIPVFKNTGSKLPRKALYWHYPLGSPHFLGGRSSGAIRLGDWKLHEDFTTGKRELYNLNDDMGESRNLASIMPRKVADLHRRLKKWREQIRVKSFHHAESSDSSCTGDSESVGVVTNSVS